LGWALRHGAENASPDRVRHIVDHTDLAELIEFAEAADLRIGGESVRPSGLSPFSTSMS
jgi:hypothetical protein